LKSIQLDKNTPNFGLQIKDILFLNLTVPKKVIMIAEMAVIVLAADKSAGIVPRIPVQSSLQLLQQVKSRVRFSW
jgi:hypothetical protein